MQGIDSTTRTDPADGGISDWTRAMAEALRSPLTAITGFLELIDEQWDELSDDQRRRHVATSRAHAARAVRVLERADLIGSLGTRCGPGTATAVDVAVQRIVVSAPSSLRLDPQVPSDLWVVASDGHVELMVDDMVATAARLGARAAVLRAIRREDRVELGIETQLPLEHDRHRVFGPPPVRGLLGVGGTGCNLWFLGRVAELNGGSAFYGPTPRGGSRWGVTLRARSCSG